MSEGSDPLARCNAMLHLQEINHFLLRDAGEILEVPGKLSLVWTDPVLDRKRYLAVKAAGEDQVQVNGRLYPATAAGLQAGLRASLIEYR
jgi:hypothetical protein